MKAAMFTFSMKLLKIQHVRRSLNLRSYRQQLISLQEMITHVLIFNTYTARPVCWREWIS